MAGEVLPPRAVPPVQYPEDQRRYAVCRCGQKIVTSCFGWVHKSNMWVSTIFCRNAEPR